MLSAVNYNESFCHYLLNKDYRTYSSVWFHNYGKTTFQYYCTIWELKMRILSLHQQFHEIHVYKFSSEHLSCYSIVSKEEIINRLLSVVEKWRNIAVISVLNARETRQVLLYTKLRKTSVSSSGCKFLMKIIFIGFKA